MIEIEQLAILSEIADTLSTVGVLLLIIVVDRKRERRNTAYMWRLITWLIASNEHMKDQPPELDEDSA